MACLPQVRTAQREEAVRKAKEEKKKKAEAAKKSVSTAVTRCFGLISDSIFARFYCIPGR
jgi:hypothetical protein